MRNAQLGKIKKSSWLRENNNYCFKCTNSRLHNFKFDNIYQTLVKPVYYAGNSKQN